MAKPRRNLAASIPWGEVRRARGVYSVPVHYYLTVLEDGGKVLARTEVLPGTLKQHLIGWGVVERDLTRIAWDLSVAKSATFVNGEGLTVRVKCAPEVRPVVAASIVPPAALSGRSATAARTPPG
jgi:hypothetical protein